MNKQAHHDSLERLFNNIKGTSFVGLKGYTSNSSGQVSNNVVLVGFNYEKLIKRDLETLRNSKELIFLMSLDKFDKDLVNKAYDSIEKSLENIGNRPSVYENIATGLKRHKNTGEVYLSGLSIKTFVTKKGSFNTVNSRELTKCKRFIYSLCDFKSLKYRNYKINNIESINLDIKKTST